MSVDAKDIAFVGQIWQDSLLQQAAIINIETGAVGLLTPDHPLSVSGRRRIIEAAARAKLPAIYGSRSFVEAGGLMSYGVDRRQMSRHAAEDMAKILKGAQVGDLPVEQDFRRRHGKECRKKDGYGLESAYVAGTDTRRPPSLGSSMTMSSSASVQPASSCATRPTLWKDGRGRSGLPASWRWTSRLNRVRAPRYRHLHRERRRPR